MIFQFLYILLIEISSSFYWYPFNDFLKFQQSEILLGRI